MSFDVKKHYNRVIKQPDNLNVVRYIMILICQLSNANIHIGRGNGGKYHKIIKHAFYVTATHSRYGTMSMQTFELDFIDLIACFNCV